VPADAVATLIGGALLGIIDAVIAIPVAAGINLLTVRWATIAAARGWVWQLGISRVQP
jgi:hypothetical protein